MSKKESKLLKKSLSDELFSVKNNCEYVHQERRKMNIQMNEDDGLDMVRFLFFQLFFVDLFSTKNFYYLYVNLD